MIDMTNMNKRREAYRKAKEAEDWIKATDEEIDIIAQRLTDYVFEENVFPDTLKLMICEALYEARQRL